MTSNTDEKINKAIQDVLTKHKIEEVQVDSTTIYVIPVRLLGHDGDGLYFVHVSSEKPVYSTAYVIPQDPENSDDYTNINYIDVPQPYRGKGIASKLLKAIEQWCTRQENFTLIRLDNDTDINPETGLPSTLYEKAGYHYLNEDIKCEMEKVLKGGKHSELCQHPKDIVLRSGKKRVRSEV